MRFTIERIRTLVLAAGVLLILAIAAFLIAGKWRSPLSRRDIPKHLGIEIEQEANGVTYTQAHGGHTVFKIHASRVVQLRNDHATLHGVVIEIYGQDGSGVDRIEGGEFDYNGRTQTATAQGPVEITLEHLAAAPAEPPPAPGRKSASTPNLKQRAPAASAGANHEIHVKTSGLVFNQQTGIAATTQRVEFSTAQTTGSSMGASYDSDRALLVLDHDVALTAHPATARGVPASPVEVHAQHAEFDRDAQICYLRNATATTRGEQAVAATAQVGFREDGTIQSLNVSGGFSLSTPGGSHLAAPTGTMEFNGNSQPVRGHLAGGVVLSSATAGRTLSGASPTMDLQFNAGGELRHAHLERGVEMESREQAQTNANGRMVPVELTRTWHSPVADMDFRSAGQGRVEPATIHGMGGVVLTGESRRANQPPVPSRLAADQVTGQFGPRSTLTSVTGAGHASIEQTAADGALQIASGDRLQAQFEGPAAARSAPADGSASARNRQPEAARGAALSSGAAQIESAELDGHVTLIEKPGAKPAGPGAQAGQPLRATAGRAVYESAGQWLHLTLNPRVEDGGMEMTARKIDVSQLTGDAFARGDVKATWIETGAAGNGGPGGASAAGGAIPMAFGGRGPAHAIANEAQLHQSTGEATFRGHARLWQQDNAIAGPLIVIDRPKQTLEARTTNPAEPVIVVMLSAGGPSPEPAGAANRRSAAPAARSVIRVRGGGLFYSAAERRAVLRAAPLGAVTADSGGVESESEQVELFFAAPGAAKQHPANSAAPAQVERMIASGHVVLTSQGRRGTGEKLIYTSQSGEYILTGTASAPPRLTDPSRGSVTGAALIFNSRDDSVSIEGGGRPTTTQTTAPR